MSTLARNAPRRIWICTLAGVERDAHLDGDYVVGHWKELTREWYGVASGSFIERFSNWPEEANSILKFTRAYGPLHVLSSTGSAFRFPLSQWIAAQETLRSMWDLWIVA